jgi:hypothetical protein
VPLRGLPVCDDDERAAAQSGSGRATARLEVTGFSGRPGLAGAGWLTQAQAGVLKTFAGSL